MGKKFILRKFVFALFAATLTLTAPALGATFRERLEALEGVTSVTEIIQSSDQVPFAEKYIVTFAQPLDWKNPNGAAFPQRVVIGYNGDSAVNVFYVSGYFLYDEYFPLDDRMGLAKELDGSNFIVPEYRFFKNSIPEGLSINEMDYWEYLNDWQASNDFHSVIAKLKTLLSGKWAFTGISKGGQATCVHAYYFPEDADIYVSYVGPFCETPNDERMIDAICTEIGNTKYGETQAAGYRKLLLDFQVEAIKNRDVLQNALCSFDVNSENAKLRPELTMERLFDIMVIDFPTSVWQYDQDFKAVQTVMDMPHGKDATEDQKAAFVAEMQALIKKVYVAKAPNEMRDNRVSRILRLLRADEESQDDKVVDPMFYPYYIQSAQENGNYLLKGSYLRDALAKDGSGASLVITEEQEKDIDLWNFTVEQRAAFTFDPTLRDAMKEWARTTDTPVIMLFAQSDPWYYGRLNVAGSEFSPSIHFYADEDQSHKFEISKMRDKASIAEVRALLAEKLTNSAPTSDKGSHGGCDVGVWGGAGLLAFALLAVAALKRGTNFR
ncbi:MAG: hypothetical protein IJU98_03135 [Synergistaceae bacterium]|nr:hypothetical protein [Synergistaceae bacterium]